LCLSGLKAGLRRDCKTPERLIDGDAVPIKVRQGCRAEKTPVNLLLLFLQLEINQTNL
jgi:hypothetical protein